MLNLNLSLSLFLRPTWPHRMLMVGWWCSNPISEDTWTLGYVPICYLKFYIVLPRQYFGFASQANHVGKFPGQFSDQFWAHFHPYTSLTRHEYKG